jgi:hypothetical protein
LKKMFVPMALALLLCCTVLPASATSITGAGTHGGLPANCGFEVPTGPGGAILTGWISAKLWNDDHYVDLMVMSGPYPIMVKEVVLYGGSTGPSSLTVNDGTSCTGTVFTSGTNLDEQCESDSSRPEIADPEEVPPGPLLTANNGWLAGGQGDIDYLTNAGGDFAYWNTFRAHAGELMHVPSGVRRCRYVDTAGIYFMTLLSADAPESTSAWSLGAEPLTTDPVYLDGEHSNLAANCGLTTEEGPGMVWVRLRNDDPATPMRPLWLVDVSHQVLPVDVKDLLVPSDGSGPATVTIHPAGSFAECYTRSQHLDGLSTPLVSSLATSAGFVANAWGPGSYKLQVDGEEGAWRYEDQFVAGRLYSQDLWGMAFENHGGTGMLSLTILRP